MLGFAAPILFVITYNNAQCYFKVNHYSCFISAYITFSIMWNYYKVSVHGNGEWEQHMIHDPVCSGASWTAKYAAKVSDIVQSFIYHLTKILSLP